MPDLHAFRSTIVRLATSGLPLDARDRLVVVPTHAAASLLVRTIEDCAFDDATRAVLLPDFATSRELVFRLGERLANRRAMLTPAEREVILAAACRSARAQALEPPFQLRPGLVAEILRLYDELRRRQNSVDDFERRALGLLEPGAASDRGAERLVRQTRFLAAAFRDFERRSSEWGDDEHRLRARLLTETPLHPYRHAVVTVTDECVEPYGLGPADWDLLTRTPGLQRLDVVVTDTMLAGALHERIHRMLPGIEEIREEAPLDRQLPVLVIPPGGAAVHAARDREEEVAGVARRVKHDVRTGVLAAPGHAAIVVRQRLPYVYVVREVLRSAGLSCQTFDALPLASEPFAAALDLVLSFVSADFARVPATALLRSPHFDFLRLGPSRANPAGDPDIAALDRVLAEGGYLGGIDSLERLVRTWQEAEPKPVRTERAIRAGERLLAIASELLPLRSPAPVAEHLRVLLEFLLAHAPAALPDESLRARHLRARGAVLGTLATLRDAHARFESEVVTGDEVAALVRRWIESQTFAPHTGENGIHLVDADSARFGRFEHVYVAGLVEGEWPDPARRNIFYSPAVLRELGWPSEADRLAGARAAFADLLRLPASRLSVSTFLLEGDALVTPSALVDEVEQSGLDSIEEASPSHRIFQAEALCHEPLDRTPLSAGAREWIDRRLLVHELPLRRFRGFTDPPARRPLSLSALERYQDCPFKFFASEVLRLEELPDDEPMSPRARGRFIHEVFQRFYEEWERHGGGAITADRLDEARLLMSEVAEPLLARLPHADAALERARLFGSAISTGSVEIVFGHEAASAAEVRERWLEYRLEGEFALGSPDGRKVSLKGVADRIDLLSDNRLRVVDYKSGSAPNTSRALQVAIYALCAQERLRAGRDGAWPIAEAIYLAFSGKRSHATIVKAGEADPENSLHAARTRLFQIVDGVGRGEFPPRPHDEILCDFCAYAAVCRKDYVHD